jgi:hypothetical protein
VIDGLQERVALRTGQEASTAMLIGPYGHDLAFETRAHGSGFQPRVIGRGRGTVQKCYHELYITDIEKRKPDRHRADYDTIVGACAVCYSWWR